MNIKNFCDNMTKNNFRKLSNDDQMLLYKVALFCVQNNLGIPWKARYIINKFYERYNCSFGMGCKQIEDFDESKPYGEHDYMTMEECVSKCNMPADVLDLMVSKIDPNDKLKYIKANPKYALDKMKQGDLSTLGITYDFTYPITDIDIRWVTKIVLDEIKNDDYLKPFAKFDEYKSRYCIIIEDLDLSVFSNVSEICLVELIVDETVNIKYPKNLEKISVCIDNFSDLISKFPDTVKEIEFYSNILDDDNEEHIYDTDVLEYKLIVDEELNICNSREFLGYNYFDDLPKSLEILNLTLGFLHLDEIILPEKTKSCVFKGVFSFNVLRLNEKLEYLHIDIQGKNLAHIITIVGNNFNNIDYNWNYNPFAHFIPYNGKPMEIIVPKKFIK